MKNEDNIYEFAFKLFRPYLIKKKETLDELASTLKKAKINLSAEHYYAFSLLLVLLILPVALFISILFVSLLDLSLTNILLAIGISLGAAFGIRTLVLFYPQTKKDVRKKKIENAISFSTLYITTMAESSILPKDMFRLMGQLEEYGEISDEARRISEDIDGLGLDLPSAIERAINRSPSREWSEFLSGFKTAIISGGDLKEYLREKTKGYTEAYKRKLVSFGKILAMLLQMYLTVVGIGTVFFVVMSSLMGVIGGISTTMIKTMQYSMVLLGIPLATVAMIIIIRAVSPLSVK